MSSSSSIPGPVKGSIAIGEGRADANSSTGERSLDTLDDLSQDSSLSAMSVTLTGCPRLMRTSTLTVTSNPSTKKHRTPSCHLIILSVNSLVAVIKVISRRILCRHILFLLASIFTRVPDLPLLQFSDLLLRSNESLLVSCADHFPGSELEGCPIRDHKIYCIKDLYTVLMFVLKLTYQDLIDEAEYSIASNRFVPLYKDRVLIVNLIRSLTCLFFL